MTTRYLESMALFERALELPPQERDAFVRTTSGDDVELLDRVLAMLRADRNAHPLLEATPDELAASVLPTPQPHGVEGTRIGPYRLLREIGRGGMGAVYLAEREDIAKQVALKLVSGGLAAPGRVQRFLLERRVLARLDHPHIARLLDAGVERDGTPWFAMEYVAGQRLDRYCEEHRLSINKRLQLVERLCEAVAYAHRNLIVHRDIKPSNIVVTDDGEPKLLDFGIAKLLTADSEDTATAANPMTPEYASPEQVNGGLVTTASDVYQLGGLLHELLTGQRPVRDDAVAGPATSLSGDLRNIIAMARHAEPGGRYATAQQLAADIRRYLDGHPVLAQRSTLRYRAGKFVRRHRWGTAVGLAAAVAVVAVALTMSVQARRVTAQRLQAEQVSNLLVSIFANADPTVTQGDTVSVRTLLDRGAEQIRAATATDPEVRAKILGVVGQAYRNLGERDRGIAMASEAVASLRGRGAATDVLFDALLTLGSWQAEAGKPDSALPVLNEALAMARGGGARARLWQAEGFHALAYAHQIAGRIDSASTLYRRALALFHRLPDSVTTTSEKTLTNLGYIENNRGADSSAEQLFREVLGRRRARLGDRHSSTASSMGALTDVLVGMGKVEEADQLTREAVSIHRRVHDGPHPQLIGSLARLASLQQRRGRLAEAESTQREVLAMARAYHGESHGTVTMALANLAGIVQRQGKLDAAADLHRDALRRWRALYGDDNVSTAITATNLAYTEFLRRRYGEAETLYRQYVPGLDSTWRGTSRLASTLTDFGEMLMARGNHRAAERQFRRSMELAASDGSGVPQLARAKHSLGVCLTAQDRPAEAESLLVEVYGGNAAAYGAAHPYTVGTARSLAALYARWGKAAEAERFRLLAEAQQKD